MARFLFRLLCFFVAGASAVCSADSARAQGYKVEKIALQAPQELSAAVRETLSGEAYRVTGPNGPLCELWLRKNVPAKASATQELGIVFGQLAEGTLLGAVRFPIEVKDYRRQLVKAGVYTLRYALVPVNGSHLGVAPQRDFLIAAPAAADQSPASVSAEEMLNLSRKALGTGHPSVWSLMGAEGQAGAPPVVIHQEEADLWVLQLSVSLRAGSSASSVVRMGLVISGYAPES